MNDGNLTRGSGSSTDLNSVDLVLMFYNLVVLNFYSINYVILDTSTKSTPSAQ